MKVKATSLGAICIEQIFELGSVELSDKTDGMTRESRASRWNTRIFNNRLT